MKTTDILAMAKKHTIKHDLAAPDFSRALCWETET